jgi:hypothetical protein
MKYRHCNNKAAHLQETLEKYFNDLNEIDVYRFLSEISPTTTIVFSDDSRPGAWRVREETDTTITVSTKLIETIKSLVDILIISPNLSRFDRAVQCTRIVLGWVDDYQRDNQKRNIQAPPINDLNPTFFETLQKAEALRESKEEDENSRILSRLVAGRPHFETELVALFIFFVIMHEFGHELFSANPARKEIFGKQFFLATTIQSFRSGPWDWPKLDLGRLKVWLENRVAKASKPPAEPWFASWGKSPDSQSPFFGADVLMQLKMTVGRDKRLVSVEWINEFTKWYNAEVADELLNIFENERCEKSEMAQRVIEELFCDSVAAFALALTMPGETGAYERLLLANAIAEIFQSLAIIEYTFDELTFERYGYANWLEEHSFFHRRFSDIPERYRKYASTFGLLPQHTFLHEGGSAHFYTSDEDLRGARWSEILRLAVIRWRDHQSLPSLEEKP